MNRAILMGRMARDPEIRTTQGGISVCNFTVACDRRSRAADGTWQNQADFIPCVAWRQQADLSIDISAKVTGFLFPVPFNRGVGMTIKEIAAIRRK